MVGRLRSRGQGLNEKVGLYAKVGKALITAKESGEDPFALLEQLFDWERFVASVSEAEELSLPQSFDFLNFLEAGHHHVRRYYELSALSELKNSLRSGDVWVSGSRPYRDFDDYLIPGEDFEDARQRGASGRRRNRQKTRNGTATRTRAPSS
ncbi:MAG: hypothetical protein M3Q49_06885 [Actinomycetota bacterium]|nr:hypothetical protein [Actinomycetota bacterium]